MAAYVFLAARCLLGVVFAVSAASKVRGRPAFRAFSAWITGLPVLTTGIRRVLALLIPAVEVAIVVLLALPGTVVAGLWLAAATMAVFAAGTLVIVRRGVAEPCQCFGASTTPLQTRHTVRNAALCAVALTGVLASQALTAPRQPVGVALSVGVAVVAALVVVFLDDLAVLFA
jgi:hypothetical protein